MDRYRKDRRQGYMDHLLIVYVARNTKKKVPLNRQYRPDITCLTYPCDSFNCRVDPAPLDGHQNHEWSTTQFISQGAMINGWCRGGIGSHVSLDTPKVSDLSSGNAVERKKGHPKTLKHAENSWEIFIFHEFMLELQI